MMNKTRTRVEICFVINDTSGSIVGIETFIYIKDVLLDQTRETTTSQCLNINHIVNNIKGAMHQNEDN